MKRTCNECRAWGVTGNHCGLGYKTEVKRYWQNVPVEYRPLEKCPKPTTYKKFIYELDRRENE